MDIYLFLYLVFIVAPAGTVIHEAGHAIAAIMVKADNASLEIGTGKKLKHIRWGKLSLTLRSVFFLGGVSSSERSFTYKRLEVIWIAIAGPLSNGLAAGFCYWVYFHIHHSYVLVMMLFHIWIALINLIPFQIKGRHSDGYTIIKTII